MTQQAVELIHEPSALERPIVTQCLLANERRADRFSLALPLSYSIESSAHRIEGHSTTIDISGGGIQCAVPEMVSPETPCQISLKLPNRLEPLVLRGRIVWCRLGRGRQRGAFETGIAFLAPREYYDAPYALYCRFIATQLLERVLGR